MKKGWLIALGILLLGLLIAFLWYKRQERLAESEPYGTVLKPRIEFSTWEITDVDADRVKVKGRLLIDNPLPVRFKAKRMDFDFLIDSTLVSSGQYPATIEIEPSDSSVVVLPIETSMKKLEGVLDRLHRNHVDSVYYTVRSRFDLDIPILGDRTFTDTTKIKLPTVYLPTFKVQKVDVGKIGLKENDLAMNVAIENRNVVPFNIFDTHYTISINNEVIAEGYQADPILIKKQATTPVVFPVTLKPGKLLGMTGKMLFDKKDTPMVIEFRCKVIDKEGNNMFKNSKMAVRVEGTMDEFMAAKKQLN